LEDKELELAKKISQFPEIVMQAQQNLNPSVVANYSYQLAQAFNEFLMRGIHVPFVNFRG